MEVELRNIVIGNGNPLVLIAGPCVVENRDMVFETATTLKNICNELDIPYVFKSSYRKANRTSASSFSGIGDKEALQILDEVRTELELPILTDIHSPEEAELAAAFVDILQIPAFLCRQTELLVAAGKTGKIVNIKKGQFLAPDDMGKAAEKVAGTGNKNIMLTERGTTFGYHNLVVDMRSLVIMKETGYPVVMDATHAVQLPSAGKQSGGEPKFIEPLAKAATAIGIDALFLEVHPEPAKALSDAGSQLKLNSVKPLLKKIKFIDTLIKQ